MALGASPAIRGRALGRARDAPGIAQAPVLALTFHNTRFDPIPFSRLHPNNFS